jgi:hypothetical protein
MNTDSFSTPDSETYVTQLINLYKDSPNTELVKGIILNTLKLLKNNTDRGDIKIIYNTLKDMGQALRIFAPYRHIRKVSIFGSARIPETDPEFEQAVKFAEKIKEHGFMIITGAGDGIMKAAQKGAGREHSFGVNIRLPFEQQANEYIRGDPKLIHFKYFFTRKLFFIKETHAAVFFPGGFGTMDEAFESLTLVQTGKSMPLPIVFLDIPGGTYWSAWKTHLEQHMLKRGLISPEDLHLFKVTDHVDEACEEILNFYKVYHSLRYVKNQLIIRLQRPIEPELLDILNEEFKDILAQDRIQQTGAAHEGLDEGDLANLPRLVFYFNRKSFGRLRQMIDRINKGI